MIKKYIFIVAMLVLVSSAMAQIPQQLNYQGIARNASGEPISTHVITVRLSIIDSAANGIVTYQETKTVTTNYVGLFTIAIGAPGGTSVIGTIASINWASGKKYIKLEIDPNGASNFSLVGMNQLQSVPFALSAEPVGSAGGDLVGNYPIPSIANGAVSLAKLNPLLVTTLNGKLNISDSAAMLLPYVKQAALSTLLSNTVIQSDLDLKENIANKSATTSLGRSDVLFPTQNAVKTYVDAAVAGVTITDGSITDSKIVSISAGKIIGVVPVANGGTGASTVAAAKTNFAINNVDNTSDVSKPISTLTQTALDFKENATNKSITTTLGTSDVLFPTQNAVKTYVDAVVAGVSIADGSITDSKIASISAGKITGVVSVANGGTGASTVAAAKINFALNNVDNTTDLNKPISILTQTALNTKENTANKSVTTTLGTSDVLFPTQNAVKTYVDAAVAGVTITDGSITDSKIVSISAGKITGVVPVANGGTGASTAVAAKTNLSLQNVDNTTDFNKPISTLTQAALDIKENTANKSVTTTLGTSDVLFPTQNAVKIYVDAAIATTVIADATITDSKIISLTASKLTGVVPVAKGGTGSAILSSGYVKAGASQFTTTATIPINDVAGAIKKVNGTSPDANGDLVLTLSLTYTGIYNGGNFSATVPTPANSNIYIVSSDPTPTNNGRTFIYDGTMWREITANQASTDARYLRLDGGTLVGDLTIAATKKITLTDQPASGTDAANKTYVDAAVAGATIADGSITDAKIISLSASKLTGVVAIANGGTGASTIATAKTNLALNNVDNTTDLNKPISTLTVAALNIKENTANKSTTITLGTSDVLFPTQNAVKTYVDAAIATTAIADGSITDAKIASVSAAKLTGILTVAKGGTGVGTITGIVKGNGTSALMAAVSGTDFSLVREIADEFAATAGQTVFTLTQTKSANSKVKMFINGVRISNTAYALVGTTLTYTPASNASYTLTLNDRIQFDYYY